MGRQNVARRGKPPEAHETRTNSFQLLEKQRLKRWYPYEKELFSKLKVDNLSRSFIMAPSLLCAGIEVVVKMVGMFGGCFRGQEAVLPRSEFL
jgi:hypothetical protein